jgi:hypothetical protein
MRVDPVGLHLRVADRFHIFGVRQAQINPGRCKQVAQPVPALHTLNDRAVRADERTEIRHHCRAIAAQLRLASRGTVGVERVNDERALVEIDSGEQHRGRSDEVMGEMWHAASSFGTSFVGADERSEHPVSRQHPVS